MVAVKSLAAAFGLASVKVATVVPLIEAPSAALRFTPAAVSAASATVTLPESDKVALFSVSVMVTLGALAPSSP